ncbi:ATP-binding protein [Ruminococcus sp. NK3A76]|uniref:ATP-binding protein n=1 Tax=Ruminococcus sp. NK3A76 TaxID=877411 RepID=UPI00048CE724|nr:ATP-binding protein [Ruminococcus sp. NK3A76]
MQTEKLYGEFFDFAQTLKPYSSDKEELDDLFSLLDMSLTLAAGAKGLTAGDMPPRNEIGAALGMSVSSSDLGELLMSGRRQRRQGGLSAAAKSQLENAFYHIEARKKRGLNNGFISRFEVVCRKFALDDFERFCLLLALSVEYDRKYEAVFTYLHNNSTDQYPSKWLAQKLYAYLYGKENGYAGLLDGESPLCRFLCDKGKRRLDRGESAQRLLLSTRAASYILGESVMDKAVSEYCRIYPAFDSGRHIRLRNETFSFVEKLFADNAFKGGTPFVMNICGPAGIGRRYCAEYAVSRKGLRLLDIDLYKLISCERDDIRLIIDRIYTETLLLGAVPCFTVDTPLTETDSEGNVKRSPAALAVKRAGEYIITLFDFVFWVTHQKDDTFIGTDTEVVSTELPMLTANERKLFWDTALDDGVQTTVLANSYILTPDGIIKAARGAYHIAAAEGSGITNDILSKSVRQQSSNQLGGYASKINAVFTWDDLVIGDDQKRKMMMICDQVKYRSVVNEDWGFRKKSPYGRGLCALFYGSPGTGKTMAVQVIANELGLDLYRIDLSQLSSKYIGETQKNISNLFNKAKNINAMLFFDEADSMFAKRSEVKDSNDRYANADTAFLLQKLEDYEGITILATNYVNNIDDAFKRRIKFMINFVFPTPDIRLMLWQKILPAAAKTDEPIDFEFFAEHFELSGSNIKEILTNAAFLAASQGQGIRNAHIIEAVKLNFSKYGKILTDADFGYLAL